MGLKFYKRSSKTTGFAAEMHSCDAFGLHTGSSSLNKSNAILFDLPHCLFYYIVQTVDCSTGDETHRSLWLSAQKYGRTSSVDTPPLGSRHVHHPIGLTQR